MFDFTNRVPKQPRIQTVVNWPTFPQIVFNPGAGLYNFASTMQPASINGAIITEYAGEIAAKLGTNGTYEHYSFGAGPSSQTFSGVVRFFVTTTSQYFLFETGYIGGFEIGTNGTKICLDRSNQAIVLQSSNDFVLGWNILAWSCNGTTGRNRIALNGVLTTGTDTSTFTSFAKYQIGKWYDSAGQLHYTSAFILSLEECLDDTFLINITKSAENFWGLFVPRNAQVPVSWNPDPGVQNASIAHGPYPLVQRPSVIQSTVREGTAAIDRRIGIDNYSLLWSADTPEVDRASGRTASITGTITRVPTLFGNSIKFENGSYLTFATGNLKEVSPVFIMLATFVPTIGIISMITSSSSIANSGSSIYNRSDGVINFFNEGVVENVVSIPSVAGNMTTVIFGCGTNGIKAIAYDHVTKVISSGNASGGAGFTGNRTQMIGASPQYTGYNEKIMHVMHAYATPCVSESGVTDNFNLLRELVTNPWQLFSRKTVQPFPGPRRKLM